MKKIFEIEWDEDSPVAQRITDNFFNNWRSIKVRELPQPSSDTLTIDRATFHSIACEIKPTIAEDSGLPEWSSGELDKLFNCLRDKIEFSVPSSEYCELCNEEHEPIKPKKLEKIGYLPYGVGGFEITNKINEIIDRLNEGV